MLHAFLSSRMKSILLFLLAVFALGSADEEECPQLEICIESLLVSIFEGSTGQDICDGISSGIECLREKAEECDFDAEEVEDGLEQFQNAYHDACNDEDNDDEDDEMQKCFDENEEYVYECMHHIEIDHILEVIGDEKKMDPDTLACTLYNMMAECSLGRISEKCGEKASEAARQDLFEDIPDEVKEACLKAHEVEIPSFMFLEERK